MKPLCPTCGVVGKRDEKHDAYYCSYCNEWLEPSCSDKYCGFCKDRPEKPNNE